MNDSLYKLVYTIHKSESMKGLLTFFAYVAVNCRLFQLFQDVAGWGI